MNLKIKTLIIFFIILFASFVLVELNSNKAINKELNQKLAKQKRQLIAQVATQKNAKKTITTRLKDKNLINLTKKEKLNNKLQINKVKFSDLNLTLLSILKISKIKLATIKLDEKTTTYRENQEISSDIKLAAIGSDFVVIDYLKQKHKLNLVSQNKSQQEVSSSVLVKNPEPQTKKRIIHYQKMIAKDPFALVGVIRISKYQKNGVVGFKLNPNIDKKLFYQLGLKKGDVILTLDNLPITNGLNVNEIYNNLKSNKSFAIKVFRNNEVIEYKLNLGS